MASGRSIYLDKVRRFWEVDDLTELKFNRVDTLYGADRSVVKFDEAADERVAWLLNALPLPDQPRIVEIGCGIGAILTRILAAYPDAEVWGLDISSAMIAEAKKVLGDNPRAHIELTEGDNLRNIASRSIDLVVCTGVFIHILDIGVIRSYMSEAYRVLKPGGAFRFNTRYWIPKLNFTNSLGGRIAKFLYRIDWYPSLQQRKMSRVQAADFKGLYFTLSDLQELTVETGFVPEQFILQAENAPGSGYVRVNCRRMNSSG